MKLKTVTPFSVRYMEFPELLFGTSENGTVYFDATLYIELKGNNHKNSPIDFARKFSFWFETVKQVYELQDGELIITDEMTEHILIDESLALLFVAYVDPDFAVYMLERVSELLLDGVVLSDTHIAQLIRNRLTKDFLTKLIEEQ